MQPAIERRAMMAAAGTRVVDSRARLRRLVILFAAGLLAIFGRLVWLEWKEGPRFRALAARPLERRHRLDGVRGRILSRDGMVLAEDRPLLSVAVDYRWLADPPDPGWVRRAARQRLARRGLPRRIRTDSARIAAEMAAIRNERMALHQRLAAVCGLEPDQWNARVTAIQKRVADLARRVNARHQAQYLAQVRPAESVRTDAGDAWSRIRAATMSVLFPADPPTPPARVVIAEEIDDHVVIAGVSLDVVAEIEAHPDRYPGTRIVTQSRRVYPAGDRAAHVVGHLGAVAAAELAAASAGRDGQRFARETDRVGRLGVERQYETSLRGEPGVEVETIDLSGKVSSRRIERAPAAGRDIVLTLDSVVQGTAEKLLDAALARNLQSDPHTEPRQLVGGAIVVLDVNSGAILAAASAPRFDAATFPGQAAGIAGNQSARAAPLVDRVTKMALPPGSVFKVVTAIALLEQEIVEPDERFVCQGYLQDPAHERCAIYTRHGEGHGPVSLESALARSCNVYFFHHGGQLGATALVDWARRCGFGRRTGVDLPDEVPGNLPTTLRPAPDLSDRDAARQVRAAAIGQGKVTATPLQVARLMAAVANGGKLVTPHVVSGWELTLGVPDGAADRGRSTAASAISAPQPIPELRSATLDVIRRALLRVVADADGSAHSSVYLEGLPIAGKTGTAETGGGQADHAWFAGYAPAEAPRVAFAVALEHGGGGGETAAPVARRLVQQLAQLGYLGRSRVERASYQSRSK